MAFIVGAESRVTGYPEVIGTNSRFLFADHSPTKRQWNRQHLCFGARSPLIARRWGRCTAPAILDSAATWRYRFAGSQFRGC